MMHEAPVPSEGEKSSNRAIILWESASGAVSHGVDFLVHSVGIITVESMNAPLWWASLGIYSSSRTIIPHGGLTRERD